MPKVRYNPGLDRTGTRVGPPTQSSPYNPSGPAVPRPKPAPVPNPNAPYGGTFPMETPDSGGLVGGQIRPMKPPNSGSTSPAGGMGQAPQPTHPPLTPGNPPPTQSQPPVVKYTPTQPSPQNPPFPAIPEYTEPTTPGQGNYAGLDDAERQAKRLQLQARLKARQAKGWSGQRVQDRLNALDATGQPVQLDDDPSTWTPSMLAELAPPIGYNTQFRDVGEYAGSEALRNKMLNKNRAASKKKKTDTPKDKETSALEAADKPKPPAKGKPKDKTKLTPNQKRRLNNAKNRPQPGTPKRPYRTHKATYSPVGYGGQLRI